jgi:hypothetical protein
MTMLEYCKSVLHNFNEKWPFQGSLAMAAACYLDNKTLGQAVEKIQKEIEKRARNAR